MAVAFVREHTGVSIKTAGTTNIGINISTATDADNTLVARILFDNAATASKPVVSSIAKGAGETNNWVFLGAARSTSTSAGAQSSGEMWAIRMTVSWPVASYTVTLDTSVTQKATDVREFSGVHAVLRSTTGSAYSATTTAASATTTGTTPVIGDLAVGFIFGSNVAAAQAGDTDTTGGAWSTPSGLGSTGQSAATNNYGIAQYKILTGANHQTLNNSAAMTAGNGAIVAILQQYVDPSITQAAYRLYADGTETGSTALAVQNTSYTADLTSGDVNLQVRALLQATAGDPGLSSADFRLQYEKNASGTWTSVSFEILLDSYSGSPTGFLPLGGNSGDARGAQSFIGNGGVLKRAGFFMSKALTPNGAVWAALFAHDGGTFGGTGAPTGSALASSTTKAPSLLPTSDAWFYFDFPGTFTLTNGTPYFIAVMSSGTTSSSAVTSSVDNTAPTHPGNYHTYTAPGPWNSVTGSDLLFEVYTTVAVPDAVTPYASSNLTDAAATTNRLTGGTGSFVAGKISEDGLVDNLALTVPNFTELLYAVTIKRAEVVQGDTLRFRVVRNGATAGLTYTQTPTISITKAAVAPVSSFSASLSTVTVGSTVTFTDTSTNGPTTWAWDFGTGASPATASTQGPHTVTYNTAGTSTVTLTAGNTAGSDVSDPTNITVTPLPAVTLDAYRFYAEGTETGSVALAAQNTAPVADIFSANLVLQLRMRLQSTTSANVLELFSLQWEKNASGTWINVTPLSAGVGAYDSTTLVHGSTSVTNRLTGGSGTFGPNKVSENGSQLTDLGFAGNNYTEAVASIILKQADLAHGDSIRFRVLKAASTTDLTYATYPTITISKTSVLPKAHTLVDTFDTQVDPAVWAMIGDGTGVWEAGRLKCSAVSGTWTGRISVARYDLMESSIFCRIETSTSGFLQLMTAGSEWLTWERSGGFLIPDGLENSAFLTFTPGGVITYDPVAHAYLKIAVTGGNALLSTSPDGATWTVQQTAPITTSVWSASEVRLNVTGAGNFAYFDNVNYAPPPPPAQTVSPTGIATAEAVGTPVVSIAAPPAQTVSPTGIGTGAAVGTPTVLAKAKIATLTDAFDTTPSAVLWNAFNSPTIDAGTRLKCAPAVQATYAGVTAKAQYDLTESSIVLKMTAHTVTRASRETSFNNYDSTNANAVGFFVVGSTPWMIMRLRQDSTYDDTVLDPYDPVAYAWLRVRLTGTTMYWDTSPDGLAWTNRRTATCIPTNFVALQTELSVGQYATEADLPVGYFDSLNISPPAAQTVSPTGIASGEAVGTPTVTVGALADVVGVWNGTSYRTDAEVWNGTSWRSNAEIWNGTSWKPLSQPTGPVSPAVVFSAGGIGASTTCTITIPDGAAVCTLLFVVHNQTYLMTPSDANVTQIANPGSPGTNRCVVFDCTNAAKSFTLTYTSSLLSWFVVGVDAPWIGVGTGGATANTTAAIPGSTVSVATQDGDKAIGFFGTNSQVMASPGWTTPAFETVLFSQVSLGVKPHCVAGISPALSAGASYVMAAADRGGEGTVTLIEHSAAVLFRKP